MGRIFPALQFRLASKLASLHILSPEGERAFGIVRRAVFRFAFASPIFWLWALAMAKNASFSVRPAAALLLPLTLLAAPAFAQTAVKEDSVILQPAKIGRAHV